ncbi:hypothetical protein [Chitinophaga sp. 212800010-3]|uniref:hypothetical protein n=1 Tax=unclassified Chitinophaga TaxID=2619133 RepID=UPI002DEB1464|nr:hypothetical protein [Chitinophaga sp. 212800010-3]
MKKRIIKISGIAVVAFTLCANLQYAVFNYGLKDAKLSMAIMGQSTSSDGTGGSSGTGDETGTEAGLLQKKSQTQTPCETTKTTTVKVGIPPFEVTRTVTIKYSGKLGDCIKGGIFCTQSCDGGTAVSTSTSDSSSGSGTGTN